MQKTNYCADILDIPDVTKAEIARHFGDYPFETLIKSAVKFRLPDNGNIFEFKPERLETIINKYCPEMRLPYPCIAIEYYAKIDGSIHDGKVGFDAVVVIAVEIPTEWGVQIAVFAYNRVYDQGKKGWVPNRYCVTLAKSDMGITIQPNHLVLSDRGQDVDIASADNDMGNELTAVVQLMAALSCSNSIARDDDPPSLALNKKRARSGKAPFYSYKVLEIQPNAEKLASVDRGGSHASPRVHLRRGHIRRLPNGNIWINAMVVGDKSKGMVSKDYGVQQARSASHG
jgi:hypothetical protein